MLATIKVNLLHCSSKLLNNQIDVVESKKSYPNALKISSYLVTGNINSNISTSLEHLCESTA